MGRHRVGVVLLAVLAGCSMTTTAPNTSDVLPTLLTPQITTTTAAVTTTPDLTGYVITVLNGRTFDLQEVNAGVTRLTLGNIVVPDIGTCEGYEATRALARLIAGKKVRVDAASTVWYDDIDVAQAMVSFGYAKAAGAAYTSEDAASVDFSCLATTTTALSVIVVQPQQTNRPKPKPKPSPKPKPTQAPVVQAPGTEAPVETPPPAEPAPTPERTTETVTGGGGGKDKGPKEPKPPHDSPPAKG